MSTRDSLVLLVLTHPYDLLLIIGSLCRSLVQSTSQGRFGRFSTFINRRLLSPASAPSHYHFPCVTLIVLSLNFQSFYALIHHVLPERLG